MSHKIPCEMIQDLMPLYVEHLTTDVTNSKIQEHLTGCSECTEKYQRMNDAVAKEYVKEMEAKQEIDYLKKVRKINRSKMVIAVGATLSILLAILFVKCYLIGFPVEAYQVEFIQTQENFATITGKLANEKYAYKGSKIAHEEDGDRLVVYACLASFWEKQQSFEISYMYNEFDEELKVKEAKLLEDGTVISQQASKLYELRNPYIGDMSANGRLAMYLGIGSNLGNFLNSLQTVEEPYGWTMEFQAPIAKTNEAYFNERMTEYAYCLLALVENAGEVSWDYTVEGDTENERKTYTVTVEDATVYMGEDIKSYAQSERNVQELIDRLGF